MKQFLLFVIAFATFTSLQAQTDTTPEWQRLSPQAQKAMEKAARLEEKREAKRQKAIENAKRRHESGADIATAAEQMPAHWFIGADGGINLAFGDDSYNVFSDFGNAKGGNFSVFVGHHFSPLIGVRARARYMKLHSRVNLEVYNAFKNDPVKGPFFPNKGFYAYDNKAIQGELMLNLSKLFSATHHSPCNVYLTAGMGVNVFSNYEDHVQHWEPNHNDGCGMSGTPAGYFVDTDSHTQWLGTGGLLIDYTLSRHLSVGLDLNGTCTTDNMEGKVYEEWYDVHLSSSLSLTYHF